MKTMLRIIIFVASWFLSAVIILITSAIVLEAAGIETEYMPALVVILALAAPIAIGIYLVKKFVPKEEKRTTLQTQKKRQPLIVPKYKLQLVGGLNLPEGTTCSTMCYEDKISFSANGQDFSLLADKLIDVSVMTTKEIQKQYVSSIGGAVAGAMLLGPIGAILGGSAQQKSIRKNNKYLVFTYLSDEETKYVIFDVTSCAYVGNQIKSKYKYLKTKENVKVEL